MRIRSTVCCLLAVVVLASCATGKPPAPKFCSNDSLLIDANFEGGNFAACSIDASGSVSIRIEPEDAPPINQSPWYSFRVSTSRQRTVRITLAFVDGYPRYWPKLSYDGLTWSPIAEEAVSRSEGDPTMTILLPHDGGTVYVSGQELLTTGFYENWTRSLAAHDALTTELVGHSVLGRPIFAASTEPRKENIVLLGRQHPPEITGALAMRPFVDTVLGESDLARRFRERFSIIIVPLINPDGVALGHWRHNVNGIDLNRDWGEFSQPETRSVARYLDSTLAAGTRFRLMLDFHSTRVNTFYTQLPEESRYQFDFATVWLDRSRARLPDFEFKHDARARSGQANTKNYFYDTYGIPAITYELGDETVRDDIAASSPVFAEEMMRTLLETDPDAILSGRE